MRFDPRSRLHRRLPGEDVEPGSCLRLHVDEARKVQGDPVPARDLAELRTVTTRTTRKLAEAGPNAPQLIRLIRTPYALSPGRPGRQPLLDRAPPASARAAFGSAFREALAEWPEVRSTAAVSPRPRPFAPRPSAAEPIPPLPPVRR